MRTTKRNLLTAALLLLCGGWTMAQDATNDWVETFIQTGELQPLTYAKQVVHKDGHRFYAEYSDPDQRHFTGRGIYVWPTGEMWMGTFKSPITSSLVIRTDKGQYLGYRAGKEVRLAQGRGIFVSPHTPHFVSIGMYKNGVPTDDFVVIDQRSQASRHTYSWEWPQGPNGWQKVRNKASQAEPMEMDPVWVDMMFDAIFESMDYAIYYDEEKDLTYFYKTYLEEDKLPYNPYNAKGLVEPQPNRLRWDYYLFHGTEEGARLLKSAEGYLGKKGELYRYMAGTSSAEPLYVVLRDNEERDRRIALEGSYEDLMNYYNRYGGYHDITELDGSTRRGESLHHEVAERLARALAEPEAQEAFWGKWSKLFDFKSWLCTHASTQLEASLFGKEAYTDVQGQLISSHHLYYPNRKLHEWREGTFFQRIATQLGFYAALYRHGYQYSEKVGPLLTRCLTYLKQDPLIYTRYMQPDPDHGWSRLKTLPGSLIEDLAAFEAGLQALQRYHNHLQGYCHLYMHLISDNDQWAWKSELGRLNELVPNEERALLMARQQSAPTE